MKTRSSIGFWLSGLLAIAPNSVAQLPPAQEVQAVVKHLVGVMDTAAQAAANPQKSHVRMTTCLVTLQPAASNSMYLYQEQALAENLTAPYRQRVLEIAPSIYSQSVRSRAFKLTNPQALIGLCSQPAAQRILASGDLSGAICSVFLRRSGDDYMGSTPIDGCPANVRGAVRITNRIVLHSQGMDTWDRGFDASGKQVWGAKAEAYQYRWVK